ncbi:hypothetical protein NG794_21835 [Laspinema sp. D6]|nr:hypothetical protein [Laspinema sp. D3a]
MTPEPVNEGRLGRVLEELS